jgi:hypothetical protein
MAPTFYRKKALCGNLAVSHVEFTATHKEATLWVAADKTAFVVL